jgi:SAM-dependent methyltransferase
MQRAPLETRIVSILRDPYTTEPLTWSDAGFHSSRNCFPVVRGVPRFVSTDAYTRSFSFEWNIHSATQLDCHRGDKFSEEEFTQKTALSPAEVEGKLALDAGIGAGRYSEVMSRWGADVVGIDLSYAVEAAHRNLGSLPNVWVAQADIAALPFAPASFDVIFSIGVLHHTPDTRAYFHKLVPLLKPGGVIAIWVYPDEGDYVVRKRWIAYVNKIPPHMYYAWCRWYVPWAQSRQANPWVGLMRRVFPIPNESRGLENDILDTFDGYSPRYHGTHSPDEVKGWFKEAGLEDIRQPSDWWRTCMRGRKSHSNVRGSTR